MRLECSENEKTNTINVLMGVFFDDTVCNDHNFDYYHQKKDSKDMLLSAILKDSNESDYSNVAQLYRAYKHTLDGNIVGEFDYVRRVYVTGFDKNKNKGKKLLSSELDILKADIISMVKRACESIYKDLDVVIDRASEFFPILQVNLNLDVYGSGIGAAAARCFANCLYNNNENMDDEQTSLSYWIEQLGYIYSEDEKVNVSADVRFLGLFDTVTTNGEDGKKNSNSVLNLGIDCGETSPVVRGVHFCAADEFRTKYLLATSDSYDESVSQFIFPGSRSDIGGGCKKVVRERHENQYFKNARLVDNRLTGFIEIPEFVKDGWFSWSKDSEGNLFVEPYRDIVNTYSLVFLFLMLSKSMEGEYDYLLDHNSLEISKKILAEDKFLEEIKQRIDKVVSGTPLYSIYGQNKCDLGEGSLQLLPRYRMGDSDGKLVTSLRERYIHLPSNIEIDPITQKIKERTILKG